MLDILDLELKYFQSLTDVTDPYQDIVSYIMLGVNMTFLLITFLLVAPFRYFRYLLNL